MSVVKLVQAGAHIFVTSDKADDVAVNDILLRCTKYTDTSKVYLNKRFGQQKHVTEFNAYNLGHRAFPFGLLERCSSSLSKVGYQVETYFNQVTTVDDERKDVCSYLPRWYQDEAVSALLKHRCGHVSVPTGGGKTLIIAMVTAAVHTKTVVVVPSKEILDQMYDRLRETLPHRGLSRYGGSADIVSDGTLMVATHQTLTSRIDNDDINITRFLHEAGCLIVDECHHCPCESMQKIALKMRNLYCAYGVSATAYRSDGLDILMEGIVGPLRYSITPPQLVKSGYIVPGTVMMATVPKLGRTDGSGKNYSIVYRDRLVRYEPRNQIIVNSCRSALEIGVRTICFMRQVVHADEIYKAFKNDVRVAMVTGTTDKKERAKSYADLKAGTKLLLISTVGKEGLDIPEVGGVILAGGGSDPSQEVGRALRSCPGKENAIIWDTYDMQHHMLTAQTRAREKWYREQGIYEVMVL